jgi:Holliday junction DNA helicase RuvB
MREQGIVSASLREEERQFETALRPVRLADFAGQARVKENLAIAIEAAKGRREAMDHVLLYGPPGLGKTTLAGIIAAELGVGWQQTSGPVLQKKLDLVGILSNIQEREVFFIDEIHRLQPDVEEMIYSALEDFRMDILIGTGPGARTVPLEIKRFTAIGATTRQGMISAPLRGRFGLDEIDQKIMMTVLEKYGGGPVGLTTIAASIDEEPGTIEEVYEPYLMQLGFLDRTPRGRVATERAFDHFGVARRMRGAQNSLF